MKEPKFASDSIVQVTLTHDGDRAFHFVEEMDKRILAVQRMLVYTAAKDLLDGLLNKLPKKDDYKAITDNLVLSEVPTGKGKVSFAVHVDVKGKRIKKIDLQKTVIYVRARKQLSRPLEKIVALEDMGPWTPDTIPFWPMKRDAIVIQRKVSKREADKIAKMQEGQKAKVRARFASAGSRDLDPTKDDIKNPSRKGKQKAIPDVAMLAMSLEFGEGDNQAVPAWRTTVQEIFAAGLKTASRRYKQIDAALEDPGDKQWKIWPKVQRKLALARISDFDGFQQRLK